MMRGIRGATTVEANEEREIVAATEQLLAAMIERNDVKADDVASVFISTTEQLNAVFPAKALRLFPEWTYVPVMCMKEIDVTNSLANCIRVMMHVNTAKAQQEVEHIYLNGAIVLRPDLKLTK